MQENKCISSVNILLSIVKNRKTSIDNGCDKLEIMIAKSVTHYKLVCN